MKKDININGVKLSHIDYELLTKGFIKLESNEYLYIQLKMNAKMFGVVSISTSPLENEFCKSHRRIKNCVCNHCFSIRLSERYSNHEKWLVNNGNILKNYKLTRNDLKLINYILKPYKYIRIESFGDIENALQLENYMNIIKTNKSCYFGFWTKNYKLMKEYLNENKWISNATLVLSNYIMNNVLGENILRVFSRHIPMTQLKTFNVYDHNTESQNCLKRCLGCLKCYSKNNTTAIIERLK